MKVKTNMTRLSKWIDRLKLVGFALCFIDWGVEQRQWLESIVKNIYVEILRNKGRNKLLLLFYTLSKSQVLTKGPDGMKNTMDNVKYLPGARH